MLGTVSLCYLILKVQGTVVKNVYSANISAFGH
jgi:hypothetical protein